MSNAQVDAARIATRIPSGTWDTHMHVMDPVAYPVTRKSQYKAATHTLDEAQTFLQTLGIRKLNIVQPSIYGYDNSCLLDSLKRLGADRSRGTVQFDPEVVTAKQLRAWHELGVRGVRINYKSTSSAVEPLDLLERMTRYANAVKEFGWALELYISLEDVQSLETIMPHLGKVKVCVDHFGHPTPETWNKAQVPRDLPGFQSLVNLLSQRSVWVKISAPYRLTTDPRHPLLEAMCRELLRTAPDRCLFATDWPHVRFDGLMVCDYLEPLLDWIEGENVSLQTVLVDNADEFLR